MAMTEEQGIEAAKKARSTATMARTLAKALARRYGKRWCFVDFLGPAKSESAGIVDILAIRKDGRRPNVEGLKRLDLFEMILIQVKGGSARSPTTDDVLRMRILSDHYGAQKIVLFEWTKEKRTGWALLDKHGNWDRTVLPSAIFA